MNTSVVIPLGKGSRWNNTELRYCLRSVVKHLKDYGDIFIIGEKPDWLQNVIHIPAKDGDQTFEKERNIYNKIMLACRDERVTDDFYFTNDDHFLQWDLEASEFPFYYHGPISFQLKRTDPYRQTVENTIAFLGCTGPKVLEGDVANDPFYLDIHCPITYNKKAFFGAGWPDWGKKWGYCIKTLYYYLTGQKGATGYPDLKIDNEFITSHAVRAAIKNRPFFSISDRTRSTGMLAVLNELYPTKSIYER